MTLRFVAPARSAMTQDSEPLPPTQLESECSDPFGVHGSPPVSPHPSDYTSDKGSSPRKRQRTPSSEGSREEPTEDIPVNIWTRDKNMVDEFEAELLDRQLYGMKPGTTFQNRFGLTEGLECVPTTRHLPHEVPRAVRVRNVYGINLPRSGMTRAGSRLHHAQDVVAQAIRGPTIFKIGITTNPVWRWSEYEKESIYQSMTLVDFSTLPGWSPMLEAALINTFADNPGMQNKASGGEGPGGEKGTKEGRGSFVYVVTGNAGQGKLLGYPRNKKKTKVTKDEKTVAAASSSAASSSAAAPSTA